MRTLAWRLQQNGQSHFLRANSVPQHMCEWFRCLTLLWSKLRPVWWCSSIQPESSIDNKKTYIWLWSAYPSSSPGKLYDYGSFSCRRRGCCNGESSRPSLLWPKFDFWTWRRKWIKLVGSRPYPKGFSPTLKIPVWSWNSGQEEPPRERCSNKHYYCYYDYFYNYHYRKRK